MAKSLTPRLGLTLFSSDQDEHGGRVRHNTDNQTLESLVAVWAGKGLLSARPNPGVGGRFYAATNVGDGGQLAVDLGDKWLELSVLGGGGAPPAPNVGGPGSEGVSNRAMRADARIGIPLATAKNHGALASEHYELLAGASAGGAPWSIPIRDGSGRIRLGANPSHVLDAASMQWVRDTVGSGAVEPLQLVRRGHDGLFLIPRDPVHVTHPASKAYVDGRTSREEWKTDVRPIPYGLSELVRLDLSAWTYNEDAPAPGDKGYGPMVGQVAEVMPELAVDGEDGAPERVRDRDMLWVLGKAVQELATQNAKLWDIVTEHQAHLDQLGDGGADD